MSITTARVASGDREARHDPIATVRSMARDDISVIIPTCDRPEYVREAIASALAQTMRPHEILVIDNGSRELRLDGFPPEVKLHRVAPRIGPARARNFGAAVATGAYLAFLDDDDWWEASFLANARAVLDREKVRCVYGRKDAYIAGQSSFYMIPSKDDLTVPVLLRRNPGIGGINVLIERILFLKVGGFDERLLLSEDRALALEVILAGEPIGVAPAAVAVFREHASDRLTKHNIRKIRFVLKYRRLYSRLGFVSSIGRILAVSMLSRVAPRLMTRLRFPNAPLARNSTNGRALGSGGASARKAHEDAP
jgi:GT2 family glycosyltransferase